MMPGIVSHLIQDILSAPWSSLLWWVMVFATEERTMSQNADTTEETVGIVQSNTLLSWVTASAMVWVGLSIDRRSADMMAAIVTAAEI